MTLTELINKDMQLLESQYRQVLFPDGTPDGMKLSKWTRGYLFGRWATYYIVKKALEEEKNENNLSEMQKSDTHTQQA